MDHEQIAAKLAVTQAMANELPSYLMGDRLYQPMTVQTPAGVQQPVLTLGALLENLDALDQAAANMTDAQRSQLAEIQEKVNFARRSLPAQWQSFLRRELKAVMDSWKWYVDEAAEDDRARERYGSEVHQRARIELLMRELANDPGIAEYRQRLAELDGQLHSISKAAPYLGPQGSQKQNPQERAWWFYEQPVGREETRTGR